MVTKALLLQTDVTAIKETNLKPYEFATSTRNEFAPSTSNCCHFERHSVQPLDRFFFGPSFCFCEHVSWVGELASFPVLGRGLEGVRLPRK